MRCGQCGEVFDASVHLLQEPLPEERTTDAAAAAQASPPSATTAEGEFETAAAPLEPADEDELPSSPLAVDVLLDDLGAPSHRSEPVSPAPPPPATTGPGVIPEAPVGKPQILRTRSGQLMASAAPDTEPPTAASEPWAPPSAPAAVQPPEPASEPPAAPAPEPTAEPSAAPAAGEQTPAPSTAPSVPAWYAEYKRGFDKAPDEPDGAEFTADTLDDLSFVRRARRRALWDSIAVRAVLGLVALVLVLLLAAQVAMHMRDRLAAMYPPMKPVLEQLCRPLGCVLQPLRQIDSVVIDSSTFNRLGPDAFRLSLTLRNQSGLDVAMPWLELTLTDTGEQPVLRRVLTPEELGAPSATVLGARSEWTATVDLGLPGEGAGGARVAGYRLLAFYP